jgi:hypothetical protein
MYRLKGLAVTDIQSDKQVEEIRERRWEDMKATSHAALPW